MGCVEARRLGGRCLEGNPRWIGAILLAFSLLGAPTAVQAQQSPRVPRVGIVRPGSPLGNPDPYLESFRAGLRELGYIEGQNILLELRWGEGNLNRLPDLAAELVNLKVDVIVTGTGLAGQIAQQVTRTIPIVMAVSGDAVATGLVASIARPGGNVTGITFFNPEISSKRLELLKEAVPRIRRVAVLVNPDNPAKGPVLQAMELTARSLRAELQPFEARGPREFEGVFAAMTQRRIDALTLIEDPVFLDNARRLADLAVRHRSPSTGFKEFAEAGGLMAYGVDMPALYRQSAVFVDKILKGTKPGDLPVQQATKFELLINLKTVRALGLTIPQSVLIRADEVIR